MTILAAFMVPHPPLIIPDVGKGGEEQIRATIDAYENIASQIAELRPETIIITSPHAVMYADYFHISDGKGATGSFSRFGAYSTFPSTSIEYITIALLCNLRTLFRCH
jgi:aromatic ring-opening dioxygenase LigB subunit